MLQKTSTQYAPWHIIESNCKYYARIKALELLTDAGVGTVIHSTETAYEFDTHPHPLSTFAARLTENLDEVEKLQTV